jgi:hypothetical protein
MLLVVMVLSALLLSGASLRSFRIEGQNVARFRRVLFLIGLIGNVLSAIVLLVFLSHAYVAAHGTTPIDLDRVYPVLELLGLGLLATILAFFGRRLSRLLLFAGGLVTAASWYIAALAVSP